MIRGMLGAAAVAVWLVGSTAASAQDAAGAVMLMAPNLADHTVFRPRSLGRYGIGRPLPIVVWGNGGCSNRGNSAEPFLAEVAAHGYLVIANGVIKPGSLEPPPRPPGDGPPPGGGPPPGEMSRTEQLGEAIAWAEAQNSDRTSPFWKKLDRGAVAAMGTSCGGLQAIEIGPDPRVTTVATFSSGLLDKPRPGANATPQSLRGLHGPILYVVGGANDGASPHARKDFETIDSVPVVLAVNPAASHGSPLIEPRGGAWAPVAIAWLDWRLKHEARGAAMFVGANCGLCSDPAWVLQSKGF